MREGGRGNAHIQVVIHRLGQVLQHDGCRANGHEAGGVRCHERHHTKIRNREASIQEVREQQSWVRAKRVHQCARGALRSKGRHKRRTSAGVECHGRKSARRGQHQRDRNNRMVLPRIERAQPQAGGCKICGLDESVKEVNPRQNGQRSRKLAEERPHGLPVVACRRLERASARTKQRACQLWGEFLRNIRVEVLVQPRHPPAIEKGLRSRSRSIAK